MNASKLLDEPAWMFDFAVPLRHARIPADAMATGKWELDSSYTLPNFGMVLPSKSIAQMRVGWNEIGLFAQLEASKADQPLKRTTRPALHFFLDTRSSFGVHRATSYCHYFNCSFEHPHQEVETPVEVIGHAELLPIHMAKETPGVIHPKDLFVRATVRPRSYTLRFAVPGKVLNGYSPIEFPEVGINYLIWDESIGMQSMLRSHATGHLNDPSLWCRGRLTAAPALT